MTVEIISIRLTDGTDIHAWKMVHGHPQVVIHLLHGMMEHSDRYRPFAEWLAERGVAVYAADHPGHGHSVMHDDDLGHLDVKSGWEEIMETQKRVREQIYRDLPGIPVVLMGHSFGSAVARSFIQRFSHEFRYAGLILSGAMQQPFALLHAGMDLIMLQKAVYGQRHRSKLMIALGYGQYSKPFSPARTPFDWLSSDHSVVDAYQADPLCGYACTLGYYQNFFQALQETFKCKNIRNMDSRLPVLLTGGGLDPAIQKGNDTQRIAARYRSCGMKNVAIKLYPEGRHEMHNEVNKMEVWELYRSWTVGQLDSEHSGSISVQ